MESDKQDTLDQLRNRVEQLRKNLDTLCSDSDSIDTDEAFESMYDIVDEMDTLIDDVDADESLEKQLLDEPLSWVHWDPGTDPRSTVKILRDAGLSPVETHRSIKMLDDIIRQWRHGTRRLSVGDATDIVAKRLGIPQQSARSVLLQREYELPQSTRSASTAAPYSLWTSTFTGGK